MAVGPRHYRRISSGEWDKVFDLVEQGKSRKDVVAAVTVSEKAASKAYGVSSQLRSRPPGELSDEEADRLARLVGYGATAKYVLNAWVQHQRWVRKHRPISADLLSEHAQMQRRLAHYDSLRILTEDIRQHVLFWDLRAVQIRDSSTGRLHDPLDNVPLRWRLAEDGTCIRDIDPRFGVLLDHMASAGQEWRDARTTWGEWGRMGGSLLAECFRFAKEIREAAQTLTGLAYTEPLDTTPPSRWCLFPFFATSVYISAVEPDALEESYQTEERHGLHLVSLGPGNHIAWAPEHDIDRLQGIHQELLAKYTGSPQAKRILTLRDRVRGNADELLAALAAFVGRDVIDGECPSCSSVANFPQRTQSRLAPPQE